MNLEQALASVENFYRRIYWEAPNALTRRTSDYTLSFSGVTWLNNLNQFWLHRPAVLDDPLLEHADEFFGQHHAQYSIIFSAQDLARLGKWLAKRGFAEQGYNPIYGLSGLPRPRNASRETTIVRAGIEQRQTLMDMLYNTFFVGPELARCAIRSEHFSDPSVRHYLAYVDGSLAGCATIILEGSIASVWNVGTLHQFRRRGIASALVFQMLVDAAADGCPESVLVPSEMGRPLYEEMGFRQLGESLFYGRSA